MSKNILYSVLFALYFCLSSTLISSPFGFYGMTIAGTVVVGFILVLMHGRLPGTLRVVILMVLGLVVHLAIILVWDNSYSENLIRLTLFVAVTMFVNVAVAYIFARLRPKLHSWVMRVPLLVHLVAFYAQLLLWYGIGLDLDFGLMTGGNGHRASWYGFYRATGFFDEPSVYSAHVLGTLALYQFDRRRLDGLSVLALISCALSLSIMSLVQVVLFVVVMYVKPRLSSILIGVVVMIVTYVSAYDVVVTRIDIIESGGDVSNNIKLEVIEEWLSTKFVIGYGLVGKSASAPSYYEALYDFTFWGANLTTFGLFAGSLISIFVLWLILRSGLAFREKLVVLIVLLKLTTPTMPFTTMFISLALVIGGLRRKYTAPGNVYVDFDRVSRLSSTEHYEDLISGDRAKSRGSRAAGVQLGGGAVAAGS